MREHKQDFVGEYIHQQIEYAITDDDDPSSSYNEIIIKLRGVLKKIEESPETIPCTKTPTLESVICEYYNCALQKPAQAFETEAKATAAQKAQELENMQKFQQQLRDARSLFAPALRQEIKNLEDCLFAEEAISVPSDSKSVSNGKTENKRCAIS